MSLLLKNIFLKYLFMKMAIILSCIELFFNVIQVI